MLSVDSRPVLGRRRRSIPAEAPTCPAYDPELFEQSQHFLSLGVSRRTDIEYARFLAGYVVEDEPKEIAEGRWSESGWCELPVSEVRRPSGRSGFVRTSSSQLYRIMPSKSSLLLVEKLKTWLQQHQNLDKPPTDLSSVRLSASRLAARRS